MKHRKGGFRHKGKKSREQGRKEKIANRAEAEGGAKRKERKRAKGDQANHESSGMGREGNRND